MTPIAHAARDSTGNWRPPHDLADHLCKVGNFAADFARHFGTDWARLVHARRHGKRRVIHVIP